MRLGGPIFRNFTDPGPAIERHKELGYSAAYGNYIADPVQREEFKSAFAEADILMAEMGAYGINLLDTTPKLREDNITLIQQKLEQAEEMGVLCLVVHGGTVETGGWGAPHPENTSEKSFQSTVEIIQQLLDKVNPQKTKLVLEACYALPHNPDTYLRLFEAIDRTQFGVHLDPVNMLTSPERYYNNGDFIRECFAKLGPHVVSCHGKDVIMRKNWPVIIEEENTIGQGNLNYAAYLQELSKLADDVPLMIEHLTEEQLAPSLEFLFKKTEELGLTFKA